MMASAGEGSNASPVANQDSDNESVKSNGSASSKVSRASHGSRVSRASHVSGRSRKSSGSSRGSPSGDEAEERRSVMDSGEEDNSEKKITKKQERKSGSRSRSRSNSGSRAESNKSRSRSRSKSGSPSRSRSRSHSKFISRTQSGSRSRSRSRSKSGSRSVSGSRSRSRSKSGSRSRSRSKSGSRSRSRSKSGSRSNSRNRSGSRSRSRSKSGSRSASRGKSGSRSRSRSKSSSRSRVRSGSRSRSRDKSGSPRRSDSSSRSRSRARSRSGSKPRSRSGSGSGRDSDGPRKKSRVLSDSDSSGSDIGRKMKKNETFIQVKRKRKTTGSGSGSGAAHSDSDSDGSVSRTPIKKKKKSTISGSESGSGSEKGRGSDGDNKIGSKSPAKFRSDDEGPMHKEESHKAALPQLSDSEDEAIRRQMRENPDQEEENVNDFDAMLARKKAERGYKRKKVGVDIINDNEENIALFVRRMRDAAEQDRQLNMRKHPATKKMAMLSIAMQQISKVELIEGFLEANVLTALTDWMAPMPDRQLPTPRIREAVLKWLLALPPLSQDMLKQSGIGKAVMYLYKHPKELKINKERCGRLINMWSRPIFNNSDDFSSLTKEDRLERDLQMLANGKISNSREKDTPSGLDENGKPLRPGDKGWCYRARVPMPSGKEYVKRPKWNSEVDMTKITKTGKNRVDKQMRAFADRKRMQKARRAVSMSIEGRNMAL